MAKQDSLKFEAEQLIDELRNKIAEAQAEAKRLASMEADLLSKAETAAASAVEAQGQADALEAWVLENLPLLKVLGLEEDAQLALSALKDEAALLVQAAVEKQEELVLEAQLLWEGHERARALIEAEQKAEADKVEAAARKHRTDVARACKVLKALVQGDSLHGEDGLLALYPKRHGQAARGKFGDATPDDASSIRMEMLRRALRGAGFFPSVLDGDEEKGWTGIPQKNWDEAHAVFRDAQTEQHRANTTPKGMGPLEQAIDVLMACGVPGEVIDLTCLEDKNERLWLRGTVRGTRIEEKVDPKGRYLVNLQNTVASLHA